MAGTEWVKNLKAEVRSSSEVEFSWSLDGSWKNPRIWVGCRNSNGGGWDDHEASGSARSFTWYDCNPGNRYDFRVWADDYDDDGNKYFEGEWVYLRNVPVDALLGVRVAETDVASGRIKVELEQNPHAVLGDFDIWWRDDSERLNNLALPYDANEDLYLDDGGRPTWHQRLGNSGSSYTASGLKGGRWYTLWVRQRYGGGGWTEVPSTRAFLNSATSLKYAIDSVRSVTLSWTPNKPLSEIAWTPGGSGEAPKKGATVQVWRKPLVGDWELVAELPPSETKYTDNGIPDGGGVYRWCVTIRDWTDDAFEWGNWDGDIYTPYISMPRLEAPKPPTNLVAALDRRSSKAVLDWTNNPVAITRPYERVYVLSREYGEGEWGIAERVSGTTETCDVDVLPGRLYEFAVQAWNPAGYSKYSYIATVFVPVEPPEPPEGLEVSVEGGQLVATWENKPEDGKPYQSVSVEVSVNDGAWAKVAELAGTAERYATGAQGNCCFRVRVRAANAGGPSAYSEESAKAYSKPAAPSAARVARTEDGGCRASWSSSARYATKLQVQPMWRDGGDWQGQETYIDQLPTAESIVDPPVPEGFAQTDAAMAYLVRSVIEQGDGEDEWLFSDWSAMSNACVPCSAPLPPDIVHPTPGCVVASPNSDRPTTMGGYASPYLSAGIALGRPADASGAIQIEGAAADCPSVSWRHNATDGSEQTAAEVELSWPASEALASGRAVVSGGSMTLADALGACGISVDDLQASHGDDVYTRQWACRVRTRGAKPGDAGWSGWSSVTFNLRRRPTVRVERPSAADFAGDVAYIRQYPVRIGLGYADYGFELMDASLTAAASDGTLAFSESFGPETDIVVPPDVWAPLNGAAYAITATVRSTSGLSNSVALKVATDFPRPKTSSLRIDCDDERGWATLTPHVDQNDVAGRAVVSLSVWRVVDGSPVLLAEGLADGEQLVDRFAPLNREFTYLLGAYSDQGVYEVTEHPGSVRSQYCFLYHGRGFEGVARGLWNHTQSVSLSRSRQVKQMYAGRSYPVLRDGGGIEDTRTVEFVVEGEAEWREFARAAEYGECFFKSLDGEAFRCSASMSLSTPSDLPHGWRSVTLDLERVDGRAI